MSCTDITSALVQHLKHLSAIPVALKMRSTTGDRCLSLHIDVACEPNGQRSVRRMSGKVPIYVLTRGIKRTVAPYLRNLGASFERDATFILLSVRKTVFQAVHIGAHSNLGTLSQKPKCSI